jgi:cold shock protein
MASGKIIALRFDRGFGFISSEAGGADIFFHSSSVASGLFDELREGASVEFDTEPDPRDSSRSRAVNVRVLTSSAAPAE